MSLIAPPNNGLIPVGQPEPSGLVDSDSLGQLGEKAMSAYEPSWEILRQTSDPHDLPAYDIPKETRDSR
jgi:hypothetical protein